MIINAYKVIAKEEKQDTKTDKQIIKDLTMSLIKEQDEKISNNRKQDIK